MPARFRDIKRAAKKFGIVVTPDRAGSSHFNFTRDGRTFPISAHHGEKTEINDKYIRLLCDAFGIDPTEFRKLL